MLYPDYLSSIEPADKDKYILFNLGQKLKKKHLSLGVSNKAMLRSASSAAETR